MSFENESIVAEKQVAGEGLEAAEGSSAGGGRSSSEGNGAGSLEEAAVNRRSGRSR